MPRKGRFVKRATHAAKCKVLYKKLRAIESIEKAREILNEKEFEIYNELRIQDQRKKEQFQEILQLHLDDEDQNEEDEGSNRNCQMFTRFKPYTTGQGKGENFQVKTIQLHQEKQSFLISEGYSRSRTRNASDCEENVLRSQTPSANVLRSHTTAENVPGSHTSSENVPGSHTTSENVPGSHTSSENVPGSHTTSENVPGPHTTSENVPGSQTTLANFPGSQSISKNVPGSHTISENVPGSHTSSENVPGSHTTSENVPGSHTSSENVPGSHTTSENVPGSHTSSENAQGSHSTSENVPGSHTTSENVPGSHTSSESVPGSHTTSENVPGSQTTSANFPGSQSISKNVPGSHTISENVPGLHTSSENVPESHTTSENVPGSHNTSENVPGSHTTSENVPGSHSTSENGPGSHTTSAKVPGSQSISKNVPGSHTISENVLRSHAISTNVQGSHSTSENVRRSETATANIPGLQTTSENVQRVQTPSANVPEAQSSSEKQSLQSASLEDRNVVFGNRFHHQLPKQSDSDILGKQRTLPRKCSGNISGSIISKSAKGTSCNEGDNLQLHVIRKQTTWKRNAFKVKQTTNGQKGGLISEINLEKKHSTCLQHTSVHQLVKPHSCNQVSVRPSPPAGEVTIKSVIARQVNSENPSLSLDMLEALSSNSLPISQSKKMYTSKKTLHPSKMPLQQTHSENNESQEKWIQNIIAKVRQEILQEQKISEDTIRSEVPDLGEERLPIVINDFESEKRERETLSSSCDPISEESIKDHALPKHEWTMSCFPVKLVKSEPISFSDDTDIVNNFSSPSNNTEDLNIDIPIAEKNTEHAEATERMQTSTRPHLYGDTAKSPSVLDDFQAMTNEPFRHVRRRRKLKTLLTDKRTELSQEKIRLNWLCTKNLQRELEVAPQTKKLMLYKERSSNGNMFSVPARLQFPSRLLKLFTRNLKTETEQTDMEDV